MHHLDATRFAFRHAPVDAPTTIGGPFVAVNEGGAISVWPLTHAAWSVGSWPRRDVSQATIRAVMTGLYSAPLEAFGLPADAPCRMPNDPVSPDVVRPEELPALVAAGIVLPDEAAGLDVQLRGRR